MTTEINFKVRGKKKKWLVTHNLDKYRLSIDAAFINWSARTNEIDPDLFAEYVVSKDVNLNCEVQELQ